MCIFLVFEATERTECLQDVVESTGMFLHKHLQTVYVSDNMVLIILEQN